MHLFFLCSHSLGDPTTTSAPYQNARTTANASSTRRTERLARPVDYENACWSACQRADPDMEGDQIGSKYIASFKNNSSSNNSNKLI